MAGAAIRSSIPQSVSTDTTFEIHYTIADLARLWRLGRETVRLLVKDEPDVLKVRLGPRKSLTRYSVLYSRGKTESWIRSPPRQLWSVVNQQVVGSN
jgi:hypothetical protein